MPLGGYGEAGPAFVASTLMRLDRDGRGRPTDPVARSLPADPREALLAIAHRRGETLANLSRLIGRGEGYLSRYVRRRVPSALPAMDRMLLGKYLGIEDSLLD